MRSAKTTSRSRLLRERADAFLLGRGALPQRRRTDEDPGLILFFNSMFGDSPDLRPPGLPEGFELTTDRRRFREARAVVFHLPSLPDIRRLPKRKGQVWIGWWMEAARSFPQIADEALKARFDLTMSHRLDSDLPITYLDLTEIGERKLREPPLAKYDTVALFLSSDDDEIGRREYATELMRHIEVHSYGRVLHNRALSDDRGDSTKLATIARYKFTLAFENAIEHDYVTEKFFQPLAAGSVPVYLGAPNIADFAPSREAYIDAGQFSSPKALAEHLQALAADRDAYARHLEWKGQAFDPRLQDLLERSRTHPFARICEYLEGSARARASWR